MMTHTGSTVIASIIVLIFVISGNSIDPFDPNACTEEVIESQPVRVSELQPVTQITYTWCLAFPPRCSRRTTVMKTVYKTQIIQKTTTVLKCCEGYAAQESPNSPCVPSCSETDCNNGICAPEGMCKCNPGFSGPRCNLECPDGKWGPGCKNVCLCENNSTCMPFNGICECTPGWRGVYCNISCPEGLYGQDCEGECRCRNGGSCHHVSGNCNCTPEWTGPSCEEPNKSESYTAGMCSETVTTMQTVRVSKTAPVTVATYTWCLAFPPRCSREKTVFKTVFENKVVPKTEVVQRCCSGFRQEGDLCVPTCSQHCLHGKCNSSNKCSCYSGWSGDFCTEPLTEDTTENELTSLPPEKEHVVVRKKPRMSDAWDETTTELFLCAYHDYMNKLLNTGISNANTKNMWRDIWNTVNSYGYNFTLAEVKNKWRVLDRSVKTKIMQEIANDFDDQERCQFIRKRGQTGNDIPASASVEMDSREQKMTILPERAA